MNTELCSKLLAHLEVYEVFTLRLTQQRAVYESGPNINREDMRLISFTVRVFNWWSQQSWGPFGRSKLLRDSSF